MGQNINHMPTHQLPKEVLSFLKDIKKNNDRDWFAENKKRYQDVHGHLVLFADGLLEQMKQHDNIATASGKKSLMRIYRDTRFSKDKTPYKTNFGGGFSRATELLRGGYYYHIAPGNSFVGGGFWGPNSDDLKRIRQEIAGDDSELLEVLNDGTFKETFVEMLGEKVKTAPRGFDKEHPSIELLRFKQFLIKRDFTDKEVLSKDFSSMVNDTFMKMRPFFNYMSDVLTTDANGEPLFK